MTTPEVGLTVPSSAPMSGGSRIAPLQETAPDQLREASGAVEGLGKLAVRFGVQWQAQVDEAVVSDRDNQMAEAFHQALDVADGGYMHSVGRESIDRLEEVETGLLATRDRLMDGLTPKQAEGFGEVADARLERALLRVNNRAASQGRIYAAGEATARLQTFVGDAIQIRSRGDDQAFRVALGAAKKQARRVSELQGLGPEAAQDLVMRTASSVHSVTIGRMIDNGQVDQAGQAIADAEEAGELSPIEADRLGQANLRAGSGRWGRELAENYLDEIAFNMNNESEERIAEFNKAQAEVSPFGTPIVRLEPWMATGEEGPAAQAFAEEEWKVEILSRFQSRIDEQLERGDFPESVYRAAMGHAADLWDQKNKADADRYDRSITAAEGYLAENKWASLDDLKVNAPMLYNEIERTPGGLSRLSQFAQGRRYVTDPQKLLAFDSMSEADLAKMSPAQLRMTFRGVTDDTDWNYVQARWRRASNEATGDDDWLLKLKDYVEESAKRSKVIPRTGRWRDEHEKRYFIFKQHAQRRFNEERKKLERDLTPAEAEQLMDEMALDRVRIDKPWAEDPSVSAYALLPEERSDTGKVTRQAERPRAYVYVAGDLVYFDDMPWMGDDAPASKVLQWLKRSPSARPTIQEVANMWVTMGKPTFLTQRQKEFFNSPLVPAVSRAKIIADFEAEGRPIDEFSIWDIYRRRLDLEKQQGK